MSKDVEIKARVTSAQKDALQALADEIGEGLSTVLRAAVREYLERHRASGKKAPREITPQNYRHQKLPSGSTDVPGALVGSGSTDSPAIPDVDELARVAEETPLAGEVPAAATPAKKKISGPRARSTRGAVSRLVEQEKKKGPR